MVKYSLQARAIWFSGDLTIDKMKDVICSVNLSFLLCQVRNDLGLTTGAGLGSNLGENNASDSKMLFRFILLSNEQTSSAETKKITDKSEGMQLWDAIFPP